MKQKTRELLKTLTELDGVPGFEGEVRDFIRSRLEGKAEFDQDNLGSLICKKAGRHESPRIMIPAHMDEIGFMVKDIHESGCLRFAPLGGWLDQVMLGHTVVVKTRKGPLPGVIGCTPPHLMPKEERDKLIKKKKMFIDVGAKDKEDAEKNLGVRVGDPIVPSQPFMQMKNRTHLLAKAWDDRVGCALLIDLLGELGEAEHPNTVFAVATVQEEVGTRGAETAADAVDPDFCIALDVGIATDIPGVEDERKVELAKGPIIYVLEAGTIAHHNFNEFLIETAEKRDIPYQLSVMEGGATDARAIHIHGRGVPSVVLGVPTRYIHCHAGIIHTDDYDATLRLLLEVARALGPDQAHQIMA